MPSSRGPNRVQREMFVELACLLLCFSAGLGQQLRWDSPWGSSQVRSPEPRSFPSLSGVASSSKLYVYGGFSHARNQWLGDLWSLRWDASIPAWEQLAVSPAVMGGPLEHATLLTLGSGLLLVGGRYSNGTFNDRLYALDTAVSQPAWRSLSTQGSSPAGPDRMPHLYWHAAVPYTVEGATRVLLCGGLDANGAAVADVYELSYNTSADAYSITAMPSMPVPLFGHSLSAGADSLAYVSGGLTGKLAALPKGVIPAGLQRALDAPALGPTAEVARSPAVLLFNRSAAAAAASSGDSSGEWTALGGASVMPRGAAFHASWVKGSVLYLYGGTQSAAVQASQVGSAPPFGLQAFQLATDAQSGSMSLSYNLSAVQDAAAAWGAVRPGALAGAAVWAVRDGGAGGSGFQPSLWLFGGWAAPQPLPASADSYLAPQDSSLAWCLDAGDSSSGSSSSGGTAGSSSAGRWLPPVQGGMAPRSAGGAMVTAVTVGGVRKLLSVGGRAAGGWTGGSGGSGFDIDASDLHLPASADPMTVATSYHLYDIWLIDADTGARQMVWYYNSTAVQPSSWCNNTASSGALPGSCSSLPYGTSASPASLGPLWDRRLLEAPPGSAGVAGAGALGSSNQAIYMHTAEALGSDNSPLLQSGIWRLTISTVQLPLPSVGDASSGNGSRNSSSVTYMATWQELTPGSVPDSSACYPRTLYGAAHLASTSSSAASSTISAGRVSYIAVQGGMLLAVSAKQSDGRRTLLPRLTGGVCLFDVGGMRWVAPPQYPAGTAPEARYRHACASRSGIPNYSMTCYGGVSGASGTALADAWTFVLQPGLVPGAGGSSMPVHAGTWVLAPANHSAVRPGPRVDHVMLSVRGTNASIAVGSSSSSTFSTSIYSPLLLLGGSLSAGPILADQYGTSSGTGSGTTSTSARRDVWLLAAGCPDPDAADATATGGGGAGAVLTDPRPQLGAQVWLSLMPYGSWTSAAQAAGVAEPWTLVAASLSQSNSSLEVLLVLQGGGQQAVGQLAAVRLLAPLDGCLAVPPSCSQLTYPAASNSSVAAMCWPGASATQGVHVTARNTPFQANSVLMSTVGFVLLDPDGIAVHFKDSTFIPSGTKPGGYSINDVRLPPGLSLSDLTVVAYGKPYVEIDRSPVLADGSATMSFNRTNVTLQIRSSGSSRANLRVDLRVSYNGLYRKRRCVAYPNGGDCDVAVTSSTGSATFEVFPIQTQSIPVSYMVVISTTYPYGTYAAKLSTAAFDGSSSGYDLAGYNAIELPGLPPPPPDNRNAVSFSIAFHAPAGYVLNLPASSSRRWVADFYPLTSSGNVGDNSEAAVNATYFGASTPSAVRLYSGCKLVEVVDSLLREPELFSDFRSVAVDSSFTGSLSINVTLAAVALHIYFSHAVWPLAGSTQAIPAAGVFVRIYTVTSASVTSAVAAALLKSGGGPVSADDGSAASPVVMSYWDSMDASDSGMVSFSVVPSTVHLVNISYADQVSETTLGSYFIKSPAVPASTGASSCAASSSSAGIGTTSGTNLGSTSLSGSASGDGALSCNVTLNYTVLCQKEITNVYDQQGSFPPSNAGHIVYGPGTSCTWVIMPGQPVIRLEVDPSGMAPGDTLNVTLAGGESHLLNASSGIQTYTRTTNFATLTFQASRNPVGQWLGSSVRPPLEVAWVGMSAGSSMPPQFVMMIAASSAAAGAMLLFLCLWHCVLRPVQMRRQAAAAALVAAANAAASAAANGDGGAPGGPRAGGHRNRVPRRYLRMMETSIYSIKEAAGRAETDMAEPKPAKVSGPGGVTAADAAPPPTTATTTAASDASTAPADPATPPVASATVTGHAAPSAAPDPPGLLTAGSAPASHSDPEAAGGELCAICLGEFEDGDRLKHLPCRHFYHVPCIEQWLGRDVTCPLCKANVLDAMRTLFGPLPPRSTARLGRGVMGTAPVPGLGGGGGAGDSTEGASSSGAGSATPGVPPPPPHEGAAASAPPTGVVGAAAAGAGAAGRGSELEMVVVVPPLGVDGGVGGGGALPAGRAAATASAETTPRNHSSAAGPLPGSTEAWHDGSGSGQILGSPSTAAAAAGTAVTPPLAASAAAAAAAASLAGGVSGAAPSQLLPPASATATAAAGAVSDMHSVPSPQIRELRPMRRHVSSDMAAATYHDTGTSTDSDSDSEGEPPSAAHTSNGVAAGRGNAFHSAVRSVLPSAMTVVMPTAGGTGTTATFSTGATYWAAGSAATHMDPSPPPSTAEVLQPSPGSSSDSIATPRRVGSSAQVAPMLARALFLTAATPAPSSPSAPQRLPRAQEAQLAVTAAALSAAAAGISSGGVGGSCNLRRGAVDSHAFAYEGVGGPSGSAMWPAAAVALVAPASPGDTASAAGAAPVAPMSYRVHDNPLAQAPQSDGSLGSGVVGVAAAAAGQDRQPYFWMNMASPTAAAAAAAVRAGGSCGGGGGGGGTVSVLVGAAASPGVGRTSGSTAASVSGSHARQLAATAVPDVSADADDVLRTLTLGPPSRLGVPLAASAGSSSGPGL